MRHSRISTTMDIHAQFVPAGQKQAARQLTRPGLGSWLSCAGTLFWTGYSFNCDARFLKEIKLLNRFPFWPSLLSVLGPATLVAAFTRGDGVGAYAAGIIVTLIGWSQLDHWYREHR